MRQFYFREKLALHQVAAKHNISVNEVREEIRKAMEAGRNSPDFTAQSFWAKVPCKNGKQSPEEFIALVRHEVQAKMQ